MVEYRIASKPHEIREHGRWACSALSGKLTNVKTTRDGKMACGHCIAYIFTKEGKKLEYTLRDLVIERLNVPTL